MSLGTTIAVAAAWLGGRFDTLSSVVLDVLFAFPGILLAVLAAAVFGAGLTAAAIALAIAYTPYIARVLRGAALKERAQQYISALEVQGLSAWLICLRHLVPNMLGLVVAQGTILFGYAMVDLAAISFIGLGVQAPDPDWGVMVSERPDRRAPGLPGRVPLGRHLHHRRRHRGERARRALHRPRPGGTPMSEDSHYLPATEALARFRGPRALAGRAPRRGDRARRGRGAGRQRLRAHALRGGPGRGPRRRGALRGTGEAPRPLEGIPFAVKDEMPIAGQPWTMGSLVYADVVADETSPLAQRIMDAGAIVHARAATPEFSCAGFTHTRLYGVTRNPWNPEFGVGGSSGGSGAALASGTATLAGGSDIGGSIRIPAAFNGVVGFKAPYGRVPVEPPFNLDHYCHNGAMARTVADCALLHNAMAGPHADGPRVAAAEARDPGRSSTASPGCASRSAPASAPGRSTPRSRPTRGPQRPRSPQPARSSRRSTSPSRATRCGRPWRSTSTPSSRRWIGADGGRASAASSATTPMRFAEMMPRDRAAHTFYEGLELETRLWAAVAPTLERYDALLCTTSASRGFVAGDGYVGHGLTVGGVELDDYFESMLTPVFNVLSRCPVLERAVAGSRTTACRPASRSSGARTTT